MANGLRRLGLERGDRVAVFLDKRIETVAGIFGTSAAGEYSCRSTRCCGPAQVAYILADCACGCSLPRPSAGRDAAG